MTPIVSPDLATTAPVASPAQPSAGTSEVNSIGGLSIGGLSAPSEAKAPFADLLSEAVGQVGQLENQARSAVEGLISGAGVDVHQAMIATEKAEMGFDLVIALRNKALSAYQAVMGMQF